MPFDKKYFIYGNREWIVMVGEDKLIETAFPPDLDKGGYIGYLKDLKVAKLK